MSHVTFRRHWPRVRIRATVEAVKPLSIVTVVCGAALVAGIVWVLGPGARWVLENVDGVPIGGPTGLAGKDLAAALDAIRGRVLAVATGLAALIAVYYTARNADTARRTFQLGERGHVTDRYGKAVEQLGSAQAPVRLGGLHALEQLAQDNADPEFRQTIVDVICAYLRMPYAPPDETDQDDQPAAPRATVDGASVQAERDPREERQVRLTAQRILADHLRWEPPPARRWWQLRHHPDLDLRHWPGIRLDLTGATLIDFSLANCRVGTSRFDGAHFRGRASFDRASFTGGASFDHATFTGGIWFEGGSFGGDTSFRRSSFGGAAWFKDVTFDGGAWFDGVTFGGGVRFEGGCFGGDTSFRRSSVIGGAWFDGASFGGGAWFDGVTFDGDASFVSATFTGNAWFKGAVFKGRTWFEGASFTGDALFKNASFGGGVWFARGSFGGDATFRRVSFGGGARFDGASLGGGAWFDGASFADDAVFSEVSFNRGASFSHVSFSGAACFAGATGLERADLAGARTAPFDEGVRRQWPACWRVAAGEDGWQTLHLAGRRDGHGWSGEGKQ